MENNWDVIVIGGGHAGCEAAHASVCLKSKTLLLTMNIDCIGQMSCNPAIGGIAKGHLVKEIDALGGLMGIVADETALQFRVLNSSKGAAVQATRCQSDMVEYRLTVNKKLHSLENLTILQREVVALIWEKEKVVGVVTSLNEKIYSQTVVITTGTFLNGRIHMGSSKIDAGRAGEAPARSLSRDLQEKGLNIGRLKTGTTPRLDSRSLDFSAFEEQKGDTPIRKFSFWESTLKLPQISCHITYTNKTTHSIISDNLDKSAIYNGDIQSAGPRYCPSIEDKIVRFPDKERHQIFVEPTSLRTHEIYPNGISTSLPYEIQLQFVRSIEGFQNAIIIKPGYAIEYDFVIPTQLKNSLETKNYQGLYLAGQINGTTGYEEAAAQGIVAGINAARKCQHLPPQLFHRDNSYIGVLIDDLVTKGTEEAYRMFTSRAEYRLLLREDNADKRVCPIGFQLGLLTSKKHQQFIEKYEKIDKLKEFLYSNKFQPVEDIQLKNDDSISDIEKMINKGDYKKYRLVDIIKRPQISFTNLESFLLPEIQKKLAQWDDLHKFSVANDIKYEGYVKRQAIEIKKYRYYESLCIPSNICYDSIGGLSSEVKEKLKHHSPHTLGQALRISGITPAAVTILMVYLQKKVPHTKNSRAISFH